MLPCAGTTRAGRCRGSAARPERHIPSAAPRPSEHSPPPATWTLPGGRFGYKSPYSLLTKPAGRQGGAVFERRLPRRPARPGPSPSVAVMCSSLPVPPGRSRSLWKPIISAAAGAPAERSRTVRRTDGRTGPDRAPAAPVTSGEVAPRALPAPLARAVTLGPRARRHARLRATLD